MPQAKHTFVESKMNKDLDDRLLSGGQYRNAVNIAVSKSEDSDVGALENVLGNFKISDLFPESIVPVPNLTAIGWYVSDVDDKIFFFLTNFCDTSNNNLDLYATEGSAHYIIQYDLKSTLSTILIEGEFLNFSTTNPIGGVNLIEDLLFWTDNRNQPRKINVETAALYTNSNPRYYTTEDQISVAKYYPYNPINIINTTIVDNSVFWENDTWEGLVVSKFTVDSGKFAGLFPDGINVYDKFAITDGVGAGAEVLQIAYLKPDKSEIIVWPRLSTTNPPASNTPSTCTFWHNTAINTTDKLLPSSARIKIVKSGLTTPYSYTAGTGLIANSGGATITIEWQSPRLSCEVFGSNYNGGGTPTFNGAGSIVSNFINPEGNLGIAFDAADVYDPNDISFQQDYVFFNGTYYMDVALPNPYYNAEWPGDQNNLSDKFVRFAYRFKFDDDEYSLISPFSQPVFIPEQDGYFLNTTEAYNDSGASEIVDQTVQAGELTILDWFENNVKEIGLNIDLEFNINEMQEKLHVKEIDILYKESDGLAIKVVESVDFTSTNLDIVNNTTKRFTYNYQSGKPFKTLPEKAITRTSDKVPLRALTQESAGNRIIYGNFIDKHTSPLNLDYLVNAGPKLSPTSAGSELSYISYPNHTLKQNRTYQVGFVLSDRYGRQSDVILSPPLQGDAEEIPVGSGAFYGDSTLYHSYKGNDFYQDVLEWQGDSLKLLVNNVIPSEIAGRPGYPGLYSEDNPLGFYTYKVVVKQKQQDYYNIYLPGLLYGNPLGAASSVRWGAGEPDDATGPVASIGAGGNVMAGLEDTSKIQIGDKFGVWGNYGGGDTAQDDKDFFQVSAIIDSTSIRFTPTSTKIYRPYDGTAPGTHPLYNNPGQPEGNWYVDFYPTNNLVINDESFENPGEMVATLLTDNINKLPPDLQEVRPNQLQYKTTDDVVYPRVARQLSESFTLTNANLTAIEGSTLYWSSQINTGQGFDSVKILGNWEDVFPGDYFDTGLYKQDQNPATATFSNTFQLGSQSLGEQKFAIMETQPDVSNLDIYWESSTSGLISDLNQDIIDANSVVGIGGANSFDQNENMAGGAANQVGEVYGLDSAAGILPSNITLISVFDGFGTPLLGEYSLGTPVGGVFPLYGLTDIVFIQSSGSNARTFTFSVIDPNNITNVYSYTTQISNSNPVPRGYVGAQGGYTNKTVNPLIPTTQKVIGEFSQNGQDERIYASNGSVNSTYFPLIDPNQFSELIFELQVSLTDNPFVPIASNGTGVGFVSGLQTITVSGSGLTPQPSYDGFFIAGGGTAATGVTPPSYALPTGAPAYSIFWNPDSQPVGQELSSGDIRYLRVRVLDANGSTISQEAFIGSKFIGQEGIQITAQSVIPPGSGYIEIMSPSSIGGSCLFGVQPVVVGGNSVSISTLTPPNNVIPSTSSLIGMKVG